MGKIFIHSIAEGKYHRADDLWIFAHKAGNIHVLISFIQTLAAFFSVFSLHFFTSIEI